MKLNFICNGTRKFCIACPKMLKNVKYVRSIRHKIEKFRDVLNTKFRVIGACDEKKIVAR